MVDELNIAVIVPIFNCEYYLADCLDSLLAQTYKNWIAYCVDDGSKDNSGAILDKYSENDSRIIALHKKNGGEHSARNYALDRIEASQDKWIAFVDGDDYISPFMFEHLVYIIKKVSNSKCQYMRLYCQRTPFNIRDNNYYNSLLKESLGEYSFSDIESHYTLFDNDGYFYDGHCGGQISSAFINSELISKYNFRGPEEMRLMGDQVFTMKCALKSPYIVDYSHQDYFYRYNPNSVIQTTRDASEYIIRCVNYVYEAMVEDGMTKARSAYLETNYLPIKMELLVYSRYKSGGTGLLPSLDAEIEIRKYLRGWKYILAYYYLKFMKRL